MSSFFNLLERPKSPPIIKLARQSDYIQSKTASSFYTNKKKTTKVILDSITKFNIMKAKDKNKLIKKEGKEFLEVKRSESTSNLNFQRTEKTRYDSKQQSFFDVSVTNLRLDLEGRKSTYIPTRKVNNLKFKFIQNNPSSFSTTNIFSSILADKTENNILRLSKEKNTTICSPKIEARINLSKERRKTEIGNKKKHLGDIKILVNYLII